MYLLFFVVFLAGSGLLLSVGVKKKKRVLLICGGTGLILTVGLFGLLSFWGEMLWFHELGFANRFWKVILSKWGLGAAGAFLGALTVYLLTLPIPREKKISRVWPEIVGAFFGLQAGVIHWETVLIFLNRIPLGVTEPVLGRDAGFYLFSLPFLDLLQQMLMLLSGLAFAAAFAATFFEVSRNELQLRTPEQEKPYQALYLPLAALIFVFAFKQILSRFHLLNSTLGIVAGPGWTDVHVRLPGYLAVALTALVCGVLLLIAPLRRGIAGFAKKHIETARRQSGLVPLILPAAIIAAVWGLFLFLAPLLSQWLRVEPNEITAERSYIEHNIRFTQLGFNMQEMKEREFPAAEELTRQKIEDNRDLMSEVRLWDWRALASVYEQFQEIRLYYTFPDIDIDRYTIGGDYRQVMVSAREMDLNNLAADSRTFVNKRFKYTHGYGITMSTVREFTEEGLPHLLIKDIPPQSADPSLDVKRPQIYYGTLTDTPVVANTKEKEFDYPSGDRNVYTRYDGHGGVPLSSFWRKLVYGWMFDGTRFLLSGYPTDESRILFHREVVERARRIAPFLTFEPDPYIVLNDGRLFWIIDAYTLSSRFPYSEPFSAEEEAGRAGSYRNPLSINGTAPHFRGANYIRNSVKVVVDAYQGDVSFYVYDPDDAIVNVWQKIFPKLFKPKNEMPAGLRKHVRYPSSYLLTQGLVYCKYHMTDPAVFYNQEDLWVRATEKYYQQIQPVEPYYIMWKSPGSNDPQFVLILPFTPKNKQVLIGWMAAMCDGENYGRLLTYKFPKEKRILGPQQVETKIDQDRNLSGQLTLWDQRGSRVIRGNVLAIPIDDTLLYVEPIYLQSETAAYPELRLVAVMHGDKLSYAETFDEALAGLFTAEPAAEKAVFSGETSASEGARQLSEQAQHAFDNYLRLQAEKKFTEAAAEIEALQEALQSLLNKTEQVQKNE